MHVGKRLLVALVMLSLMVPVFSVQAATPPPTIDQLSLADSSANQVLVTGFSTANAKELIVGYTQNDAYALKVFSDTAGLTWTVRTSSTLGSVMANSTKYAYELYAWTSSTLVSDQFNATFAGSGAESHLTIWAINGADTQNPFDPNNSLPCVNIGAVSNAHCVVSTTSSSALILANSELECSTVPLCTAIAPFTVVPNYGFTGQTSYHHGDDHSAYYLSITDPSLSQNINASVSYYPLTSVEAWSTLVDAVQAPQTQTSNLIYSAWWTGTIIVGVISVIGLVGTMRELSSEFSDDLTLILIIALLVGFAGSIILALTSSSLVFIQSNGQAVPYTGMGWMLEIWVAVGLIDFAMALITVVSYTRLRSFWGEQWSERFR